MAYQTPKQYNLYKLSVTTHENKVISVMQVMDTLTIVEDIYTNFLYGSLVIEDANDLHQIAPLIGEETITMVYRTDEENSPEIQRVFRVYRIESSDDKYADRLSHKLLFVSKEAFDDANTVISKSYNNKSLNTIISHAFSLLNSNKVLNIGDMSGNYHIISPNWSPFQLINYCTSIANPKSHNSSMVLFYENSDGYNFKHVEELLNQPIIDTWKSNSAKTKFDNDKSVEINHSNNIIEYKILKNSVDTLKSMAEGLYNNMVISYDHISKTVKKTGYNYAKEFENTVHLSGFKLNSENHNYDSNMQRMTYIPTNSHHYDSSYVQSKLGKINLSEKKENIIPSRTSILSQISAKQMEITVAGDNRLVAGRTIKIEIPNITALDNIKNNKHRYNSKKVLITSVTNVFTLKSHVMILRVADDSYTEDLRSLPEFDKVADNV